MATSQPEPPSGTPGSRGKRVRSHTVMGVSGHMSFVSSEKEVAARERSYVPALDSSPVTGGGLYVGNVFVPGRKRVDSFDTDEQHGDGTGNGKVGGRQRTGTLSLSKRGHAHVQPSAQASGRLSFSALGRSDGPAEDDSTNLDATPTTTITTTTTATTTATQDTSNTRNTTTTPGTTPPRRGRSTTVSLQEAQGKLSFVPAGFEAQPSPPAAMCASHSSSNLDSTSPPGPVGPANRDVGLVAAGSSTGRLTFVPKNTRIQPRHERLGESHIAMYAADIHAQSTASPAGARRSGRRTRAHTVAMMPSNASGNSSTTGGL